MIVFGTRPEAVKLAPVIRGLRDSARLHPVVTVSGQHRILLDQVLSTFDLSTEHDLRLLSPDQTPSTVVSGILEHLPPLLRDARFDAVLVQGDTSTALGASMAAFHERIPVVHLEAGLRTDDWLLPFPEETNRRLIARLAQLHLAPTARCAANLLAEGISRSDIVVTGNTVIDALRQMRRQPPDFADRRLAGWYAGKQPLVVVTMHRRESWGEPMRAVAEAVATLARRWPAVSFAVPLHPNPLVRACFRPALAGIDNVLMLEPLRYEEMVNLIARARLVLTDSGGIQEEAPALGTPVLVLRQHTERYEAVEVGVASLVGHDQYRVVAEAERVLADDVTYRRMAHAVSPFGDGGAAPRVVAAIGHLLGVDERRPEFDGSTAYSHPVLGDPVLVADL